MASSRVASFVACFLVLGLAFVSAEPKQETVVMTAEAPVITLAENNYEATSYAAEALAMIFMIIACTICFIECGCAKKK